MNTDFENWVEEQLNEIDLGYRLERPSPHQSLFKYVSLSNKTSWNYLEQTLHDNKMIGSTPNSLNDPFELQPAVFNDLKLNDIASIFRKSSESDLPENLRGRSEEYYLERARAQIDIIREDSRVISLSERYDSPLLWAHYANSYKGACLHFLGGKIGGQNGSMIGRVRYADQRPMFPLSLALALSVGNLRVLRSTKGIRSESNKIIFFTKAADWEYEKEYRIIYNTGRATNFEFNDRSLVSIIAGPNMPKADLDDLLSIVRNSRRPDIAVRQAKISKSSFAVQIDWDRPI